MTWLCVSSVDSTVFSTSAASATTAKTGAGAESPIVVAPTATIQDLSDAAFVQGLHGLDVLGPCLLGDPDRSLNVASRQVGHELTEVAVVAPSEGLRAASHRGAAEP